MEIASERDLKNIINREKKYNNKENLPQDVELEEKFWNSIKRDRQLPDTKLVMVQSMHLVEKELSNYFTSQTDILLAKMVLSEERETDSYADVLQISSLPIEDRRKEVKKNKDRIKKVLDRNQVHSKLKRLLQ